MGMAISSTQMTMNIGESGRMTLFGERESNKKMEFFTKKNMKKATL
jgi:hypothetical protein